MVVLQPEENIPIHLTTRLANGLHVMARDTEGWCVAVDGAHELQDLQDPPQVCRQFVMNGPYCRFIRAESAEPQ